MRFGLIGDVHAEDVLLQTALDHLTQQSINRVLCVGDITDGRGNVDRCVDLLEQHHVAVVRGNHDRWCVAGTPHTLDATSIDDLAKTSRWYLAHLPTTRRFDTPIGSLLLCHAFGNDDMIFIDELFDNAQGERERRRIRGRLLRLLPERTFLVVCGHSHQRGVRKLGSVPVINAGTLRADVLPGFGVLDTEARKVQWFDLEEGGSVQEAEIEPL